MSAADFTRPASGIATAAALVAAVFALLGPIAAAAPPDIPRRAVEPSTCPIVVAPAIVGRTSCGRLTVPEDRRRADGRTVTVEFMMVAAERPDPARLPLLFVMGGNGSGLKMAQRQPRLVASLAKHDTVIFVDHRGSTPWGRPDMSCPAYPEGLDAAAIGGIVLDGMSGIESNAFAEAFLIDPLLDLIDECAAAAQCRSAYPDFERQLGSVAAELEQRPQRIGGELVSNVEYLAQVRYALMDPERRSRIPLAVERSARGDHRAWAALRIADGPRAAGGRDPAFTWPGSVCRDEHPRRADPDRQQAARRTVPDAVRRGARMVDGESWDWTTFCPRMGFEKSAPETVAIPRSDVPALMLVGQLDLVTPKTWNDQVARSMSDARTVVFPSTDHFVLLRQTQCAGDLMRGFYADPKAPLDTRCVDALPKTVWAIDRTDKARR